MSALLENLASPALDRSVKISVVACFGDIAMAIGPAFEPYLSATMNVLKQAGEQKVDAVSPSGPSLACGVVTLAYRKTMRRSTTTRS